MGIHLTDNVLMEVSISIVQIQNMSLLSTNCPVYLFRKMVNKNGNGFFIFMDIATTVAVSMTHSHLSVQRVSVNNC